MSARIHLTGSASYRLKAFSNLSSAIAEAGTRRIRKGPLLPGWNWFVEMATGALRKQLITAFEMGSIPEARRFLNSIEIKLPICADISRSHVALDTFSGDWFEVQHPVATVLYFHGGGYTFYPRSYSYLLELITQATKSRLFALDYRLAPEHKFPAQLEDAVAAYAWLVEQGVSPETLVLAGDSAGAHLALGCLLRLRDLKMPIPRLAVALSPPTDFETDWPSITRNAKTDWIQKFMLERWAAHFCSPGDWANPLVWLARADLTKLCPIYIQCGSAEILHDSIQAFGQSARTQGVTVAIESWPDMNHVFQLFGSFSPQSTQALSQIGKAITETVRSKQLSLAVR